LRGQAFTTANIIGDNLDDLSEYLGAEYQPTIDGILERLQEMQIPERYTDVIRLAREAIAFYSDLLEEIDERQGFTSEDQG
jgi:hypothetical protein